MLPEERARVKIDKQLKNAGWDVVSRDEYVPKSASAVKEALMQGKSDIEQWIIDYSGYNRNSGDDTSRAENAIQMIERDANAYALSLLRLYHAHDSMELQLGLPDITASDAARYENRAELRPAFIAAQRRYQSEMSATRVPIKNQPKIGRNDPCPCGSGLKYKKCHCPQYHEEYR